MVTVNSGEGRSGQLSGTCNVQRFQLHKRHMAASIVKGKKATTTLTSLHSYIFLVINLRNCWSTVL